MSTTPNPTATPSDVCTVTSPNLALNPSIWHVNNTSSVNVPNFDYLPPPSAVTSGAMKGSMLMMASYSQHMAGGLIGTDMPFPPAGCSGRKFLYAAMNVRQQFPPYPDKTIQRNELDLKWTIIPATNPNSPNQANGSTQINADNGQWQLDPSGQTWVNTGYVPTSYVIGASNVFQIRLSTDGVKVWSVTGLQCNSEPPFIPGSAFQNIPLITTNWTAGLHPQLQFEGGNEPFCVTNYYWNVQVITSDAPIPMIDPTKF